MKRTKVHKHMQIHGYIITTWKTPLSGKVACLMSSHSQIEHRMIKLRFSAPWKKVERERDHVDLLFLPPNHFPTPLSSFGRRNQLLYLLLVSFPLVVRIFSESFSLVFKILVCIVYSPICKDEKQVIGAFFLDSSWMVYLSERCDYHLCFLAFETYHQSSPLRIAQV